MSRSPVWSQFEQLARVARSTDVRLVAVFAVVVVQLFGSTAAVPEDSVAELVKAVQDLSPEDNVLELPEGDYTIASTWTIIREGLTIHGAGIGKTVLRCSPNFKDIMVNIRSAKSTISGLTLDGYGTPRVLFLNGAGVVADNIEVKNFSHIGIGVPPSGSDCRISNCLIKGPRTPSSGIWRDTGPNPTNSSLIIEHNTITASGIYCTGGKITIVDNRISGSHCERQGGGGQVDVGNAFTTNTNAVISSNTIVDGGGPQAGGIEMGSGNFVVSNNTIRNHGASGITLNHNVTRASITGNVISNSGHYLTDKNSPQARSAIYVLYGPANLNISGNRCFDDQPVKTQTWGIILAGVPVHPDPRFSVKATEHVRIANNDLRGNIHPEGLLDQSSARDKTVFGNLPRQANP